MHNTHIVIMAGGIGSRLWPVSTPDLPKQFLDLLGVGKSLIQLTVERFRPLCDMSHFWVVTSERYVGKVREQLPDLPVENILSEPEPRNTAPCIAYACWKIARRFPDANIAVTPSDAIVLDKDRFARVIGEALAFTEKSSSIVTVGIAPSRPETGYGYIRAEAAVCDRVVKVLEFREKPDYTTAQEYLAQGGYFWNAGIFVWNADTIISAFRRFAPQIADVMDEMSLSFYTPGEASEVGRLFGRCEKISIDYAVMEKSDNIHMIASDLGWSDLGSWTSVRENIGSGAADSGNRIVGKDVRVFDTEGSIIHVSDLDKVIVSGLSGFIVAERAGNLLICPLSSEQRIKDYM